MHFNSGCATALSGALMLFRAASPAWRIEKLRAYAKAGVDRPDADVDPSALDQLASAARGFACSKG